MERCAACGKNPLGKDEVGVCKKLIAEDTTRFYCLVCLAEYLGVTAQDILDKIEDFKEEGCVLFP